MYVLKEVKDKRTDFARSAELADIIFTLRQIVCGVQLCKDCKKRPATFYCPDFGPLCHTCCSTPSGTFIRGMTIPVDTWYKKYQQTKMRLYKGRRMLFEGIAEDIIGAL